MRRSDAFIVIAVVIAVAANMFVFFPDNDDRYAEDADMSGGIEDYSVMAEPLLRIINLTDIPIEDQRSKYNLNDGVEIEYAIPSETEGCVLFIDSEWVRENNMSKDGVNLSEMIDSGCPVVLVGNDPLCLMSEKRGYAFGIGSVYCIYCSTDGSRLSCYTVTDYNQTAAVGNAYSWAVSSVCGASAGPGETSDVRTQNGNGWCVNE